MTHSQDLFARARDVIPGGVNSPVRAFGSVGGTPRMMVKAAGPYVTDADGVQYVDLVNSWGPAILGHAHPRVVEAVQDAAALGLGFGATTPAETELAELVTERVCVAGVDGSPDRRPIEKLRLVSTGTEATMTAIRLARGFTGRDLLVKFAGHYHGHSDSLLAEAGSGVATLALPGSAGIPEAIAAQTIVVPYNDRDAIRHVFGEHGPRIAAVITEAAAANMGVVPPLPGFTAELARLTHDNGSLLISDEVLTGFRVHAAGYWGLDNTGLAADHPDAWTPDLVTFGKVIGGGLPVAALGGRADVMDRLAPLGPVYQAGTLSGNPVAVAAGLTTLRLADADVYRALDIAADILIYAVELAFEAAGLAYSVQRAGNLFSFTFGTPPERGIVDYQAVQAQETWRYPAFFHAMLDAGVSLPPSIFEAWFVSAAMDEASLDRVIRALPAAARAAADATPPA